MQTHCPLDCPDSCTLEVVSEPKARILGADVSPTNRFICKKVTNFLPKRQFAKERILQPHVRKGDSWQPVSWDNALDLIAEKWQNIITEFGAEAIVPVHYGGSNGLLTEGLPNQNFFHKLGASRCNGTICAAMATAALKALYGKAPGLNFEDFARAKTIVVWGANPKGSNIHLMPYLKQAKKQGAKLISVNPLKVFSNSECDLFLQIQPGTDAALALGLVNLGMEHQRIDFDFLKQNSVGFEDVLEAAQKWPIKKVSSFCGVAEEDILQLFQWLNHQPVMLRCGWGLERNRNGAASVASVLALPAMFNFFGAGGGFMASNSAAVNRSMLQSPFFQETREVNLSQLALEMEADDPAIRSLYVFNANPVAMLPNQKKLLKEWQQPNRFIVTHDQVWTDSAKQSDVVLPATTFLEHFDIKNGYGRTRISGIVPVMKAEGEAKPNLWVFAQLAKRFGFEEAPFQWDERAWVEHIATQLNLDPVTLLNGDGVNVHLPPLVSERPVPTIDGKIQLGSAFLGDQSYHPIKANENGQFALISPADPRLVSSTFGDQLTGNQVLYFNPGDAHNLDIRDGDQVLAYNSLAEVPFTVQISENVRHGVLLSFKGVGSHQSQNHLTINALCPDHICPVGAGACYFDSRVDIKRIL